MKESTAYTNSQNEEANSDIVFELTKLEEVFVSNIKEEDSHLWDKIINYQMVVATRLSEYTMPGLIDKGCVDILPDLNMLEHAIENTVMFIRSNIASNSITLEDAESLIDDHFANIHRSYIELWEPLT